MSKTEPIHLVRCLARAADSGLGQRRLRLSVTQCRGFPFLFAKKRVVADLVFDEHAWLRHATGEWHNKTPCKLVRARTLRKVKAAQPVQVKVWTLRGAVHTCLHEPLGDLLQRLQSSTAPLTLDVTCSSVGVHLTWPAEATAATQLTADLASTTAADGAASGTARDSPLHEDTSGLQAPLHLLEAVTSTASVSDTHQHVLTQNTEATPPHCQHEQQQSEPSRPLRFPDSGSVFVDLLKQYETLHPQAAEDNTRKEEEKEGEKKKESRVWGFLKWVKKKAVLNVVPSGFVWFFFVNLHHDFIPRVYGTWASSVEAVMWAWVSVARFVFYAITLMPAGQVTQKEAAGKQGAPGWSHHCDQCNQPRPDIAQHCPRCQHCVWERDHHCWYVGKCLGRDNVQAFMLLYALMPIVSLVQLAILVGGAWWRQLPLTLFQCIQVAANIGINIYILCFMDQVRGRRRRMKQSHPTFFSQDQEDWFD